MDELIPRSRPTEQAVHLHYEKAGLTLPGPPIPWNADGLVVEVIAKLPNLTRQPTDFQIRIPGHPPFVADTVRPVDGQPDRCRILFRLGLTSATTLAEILWKSKLLTTVTIPILSQSEFRSQLKLLNTTATVQLGAETIAAQSFVASQCQRVVAAGLLRSPTILAPMQGHSLTVEFSWDIAQPVPVPLTANQLESKEALVMAIAPTRPKQTGPHGIRWLWNGLPLWESKLQAMKLPDFRQSLRTTPSRYCWEEAGGRIRVSRLPPAPGSAVRLGPCFVVASHLVGAAALLPFQVVAVLADATRVPLAAEQAQLVTDGPLLLVPGLLKLADYSNLVSFELRQGGKILGKLPLIPIPQAEFNGEGAFKPVEDFTWSTLADEELAERLGKLFRPDY